MQRCWGERIIRNKLGRGRRREPGVRHNIVIISRKRGGIGHPDKGWINTRGTLAEPQLSRAWHAELVLEEKRGGTIQPITRNAECHTDGKHTQTLSFYLSSCDRPTETLAMVFCVEVLAGISFHFVPSPFPLKDVMWCHAHRSPIPFAALVAVWYMKQCLGGFILCGVSWMELSPGLSHFSCWYMEKYGPEVFWRVFSEAVKLLWSLFSLSFITP